MEKSIQVKKERQIVDILDTPESIQNWVNLGYSVIGAPTPPTVSAPVPPKSKTPKPPTMGEVLADIEPNVVDMLKEEGIGLPELKKLSDKELIDLPLVGKATAKKIREALKKAEG